MVAPKTASSAAGEETLDPDGCARMQGLSHQIVDDAIAYVRDVRDRPIWREMPKAVKGFFKAPLPRSSAPLSDITARFPTMVCPIHGAYIHL
jgi:aromatic-L-amino-acid/L-tryptophan decarboxylase